MMMAVGLEAPFALNHAASVKPCQKLETQKSKAPPELYCCLLEQGCRFTCACLRPVHAYGSFALADFVPILLLLATLQVAEMTGAKLDNLVALIDQHA
jgi:hypothetical protein